MLWIINRILKIYFLTIIIILTFSESTNKQVQRSSSLKTRSPSPGESLTSSSDGLCSLCKAGRKKCRHSERRKTCQPLLTPKREEGDMREKSLSPCKSHFLKEKYHISTKFSSNIPHITKDY